eukprot:CAMPEP_0177655418 /NCGR_PEP_ID=MMETSP0447-20121125/14956_1 /TAXON_ID=0 /ORGANISM="Stygamoeba regulata, Strain BSH-02190019" /LENGTH=393 /DNA_ID=CAMNT_0019159335 /DNA_START=17 /DNA_END=1198 /DNA_ORIENTATION=-
MEASIYLDYNATTPVLKPVVDAMLPYITTHFGNPSSGHSVGRQTRTACEHARQQVAALLNCTAEEVVFTSGGSEANNYAIKGVVWPAFRRLQSENPPRIPHVITSVVEHPAVREVLNYLEEDHKCSVTTLAVDEHCRISIDELRKSVLPNTVLVTIMHANNEVGTIQPIEEIRSALDERPDIVIHTDASQSVGKIATDVRALDVDLLTVAGHKLYATKGCGALYKRASLDLETLIHGASHERGLRAGTENVIQVVGLGEACALARIRLQRGDTHSAEMRDRLCAQLRAQFDDAQMRINNHPIHCLPNTLSVSFRGLLSAEVLRELSEQVAASAGSACHSGAVRISPVLQAMQVSPEWAQGTFRFSVGVPTTVDEIDRAVALVSKAIQEKIKEN